MSSAIGDAAVKFVTKIFWPWFLKNIWPLIAKALIGFLAKRIGDFAQSAEAAVQSSYEARTAKAQQSASEAERLAAEAVTGAEREKQEAIAQVWRTVAEQFRADNEQLRQQLSALATSQQDASEIEVQSITPLLDNDGSQISLSIGDSRTALPALSSGSDSGAGL